MSSDVFDPMNTRATEYRYNVDGLLEELVCHNGEDGEQVTRWEYGTELNENGSGIARADLVRAKVYPDGGRVDYGYNGLSEVTRMEDQNGTVHEYDYDAVNRLMADRVTALDTDILDGSVRAIRLSYFARGEIEKVTSYNSATGIASGNVVNEVLYAYNGFGQEISEWQSHAGAVTGATPGMAYGYENGSANTIRLGAAVFGIGHVVIYSYDGVLNDCFDRVSAIGLESGGPDVTYERLGMNAIVNTAYSGGLEMTAIRQGTEGVGDGGDIYAGLDRFGRLQEARWRNPSPSPGVDVERVEYGFDRVGNRQWRRNLFSGTVPWDEFYRYDGLYQVTELNRGKLNVNRTAVNGVPAWQEQWRYDAMGNWLGYDTAVDGGIDLDQERTYNEANELLFINGSNAQARYDSAGNMTRAPQPADWDEAYDLKWDAWNRLVEVSDAETEAVVARYGYDGLTRRITKETEISTTPVLRHFYYSNRWQVVEERLEGAEFADRRFVWGIKHVDDLVYRELLDEEGVPIERLWALNDGKNITAIADGTTVRERYGYAAFGGPEVLDANFDPKSGNVSDFDWETLFCGYRWDEESALYQVRHRYYHARLGRWLSRDPIGENGGNNLLAACGNDTINQLDSYGLAGDVTHGLRKCLPGESCATLAAKIALFMRSIAERVAEMIPYSRTGQSWEDYVGHAQQILQQWFALQRCAAYFANHKPPCCFPHTPVKDPFPLPEWKPVPYKIPQGRWVLPPSMPYYAPTGGIPCGPPAIEPADILLILGIAAAVAAVTTQPELAPLLLPAL